MKCHNSGGEDVNSWHQLLLGCDTTFSALSISAIVEHVDAIRELCGTGLM